MANNNYYGRGNVPAPFRNYNNYQKPAPVYGPFGPKKSGTVYKKLVKGKHAKKEDLEYVTAWRKLKGALVSAVCFPFSSKKKGLIFEGKNGKKYANYMVELKSSASISMEKYTALMDLSTRLIYITKLNWVISPLGSGVTASGKKVTGYFGTIKKR